MTALLILGTVMAGASLFVLLVAFIRGCRQPETAADLETLAALASERAGLEMRDRLNRLMREHKR